MANRNDKEGMRKYQREYMRARRIAMRRSLGIPDTGILGGRRAKYPPTMKTVRFLRKERDAGRISKKVCESYVYRILVKLGVLRRIPLPLSIKSLKLLQRMFDSKEINYAQWHCRTGRIYKGLKIRRPLKCVYKKDITKEQWMEHCKELKRKSAKRRHSKQMEYIKNRYHKDSYFKLVHLLRSRVKESLRKAGSTNIKRTVDLIGCTFEDFKIYFESLFVKGMTWNKFLSAEIHIDHIRPIKSFDLTKESHRLKCFHYTNLQPLWASDNQEKSAKLDWVPPKARYARK